MCNDNSRCKRCGSNDIQIVRDMNLWWLECNRCPTTYMVNLDQLDNSRTNRSKIYDSDAKPESLFKVIKREDGTETPLAERAQERWLEGVNTSDLPIQVTISRPVEKAYNMGTGESTTTPIGPWKVDKKGCCSKYSRTDRSKCEVITNIIAKIHSDEY